MRGAPPWPKMNIQQRTTLTTFITRAATRCTCVLPRPSKNALMAIVAAIDTTPSSRQRVYSSATACTSGTLIIVFTSQGRQRDPDDREARAGHEAKEDRVRQRGAGRGPVALGVAARDDRLGADAQRAQAAAEEPHQDERRQERGLPVRRLRAGQVREEDDVDLVDDALREHRDHRGEREPEDRRIAMSLVHERRCEVDRLHAKKAESAATVASSGAKDKRAIAGRRRRSKDARAPRGRRRRRGGPAPTR